MGEWNTVIIYADALFLYIHTLKGCSIFLHLRHSFHADIGGYGDRYIFLVAVHGHVIADIDQLQSVRFAHLIGLLFTIVIFGIFADPIAADQHPNHFFRSFTGRVLGAVLHFFDG